MNDVIRELFIDKKQNKVRIALTENNKLVELQEENENDIFAVGDILLGRVKKILPGGPNAAFIDVGFSKDAFLQYFDLGENFLTLQSYVHDLISGKNVSIEYYKYHKELPKTASISKVLKQGETVLVKIIKEPINNKGPRTTSEISIAGRYLVLVPFQNKISISHRIVDPEEKKRLKDIVESIRPDRFGIIVRTAAQDRSFSDLQNDIEDLLKKWKTIENNLKLASPPKIIFSELDRSISVVRDILNDSFSSITVGDVNLYKEITNYLKQHAPDKLDIIKLHKGLNPLFESAGLEKQIKQSFGKKVYLKSGVYLIIEHTEALQVIDVNSGYKGSVNKTQEENALEANMEAAEEVARQIRLRDLGGIIIIDFIDMHSSENRKILYDKLKELMKNDRAKHTILPPTEFGLVQITRQRVRPELSINIEEKCPVCDGTGEIKPSIIIADVIYDNITYLLTTQPLKNLTIFLSPYIYAYIKFGFPSIYLKWKLKFKNKIKIYKNDEYNFIEYHIYDDNGEEILLQ
ncbi:MAG: Rne/Rng family ribonuclease [Bacteroidales bacterium]|jgi:ribonuclease G